MMMMMMMMMMIDSLMEQLVEEMYQLVVCGGMHVADGENHAQRDGDDVRIGTTVQPSSNGR